MTYKDVIKEYEERSDHICLSDKYLEECNASYTRETAPLVGEYEYGITGGAVSITKRTGSDNFTGLTAGNDLLCFNEVPEGEYNISIAPPTDYNPTTNMNYALTVKAGDNTQINFGAQKNSQLEEAEIQVDTTPKSPLLAMAGAALILGGLIIVFIFGVLKRNDQL